MKVATRKEKYYTIEVYEKFDHRHKNVLGTSYEIPFIFFWLDNCTECFSNNLSQNFGYILSLQGEL